MTRTEINILRERISSYMRDASVLETRAAQMWNDLSSWDCALAEQIADMDEQDARQNVLPFWREAA